MIKKNMSFSERIKNVAKILHFQLNLGKVKLNCDEAGKNKLRFQSNHQCYIWYDIVILLNITYTNTLTYVKTTTHLITCYYQNQLIQMAYISGLKTWPY